MHPEIKPLLYMTDLEFCGVTFQKYKVGTIMVEANYSSDYLSKDVSKRLHVLKGHAEINTTLGIIEANRTDKLQNVILCHLSQESADPMEFMEKAKQVAKTSVYVAEKGLEIELTDGDRCPFE